MDKIQFRKITARILRHSGFITKIDKATKQYIMYNSNTPESLLYCKPIIEETEDGTENYLCFTSEGALNTADEALYRKIIGRFSRLAPNVGISFENLNEPAFTEEQEEIVNNLSQEYGITIGD